jgi:hypothetical protein
MSIFLNGEIVNRKEMDSVERLDTGTVLVSRRKTNLSGIIIQGDEICQDTRE